jgi:type IV pilus assembly protein PilE
LYTLEKSYFYTYSKYTDDFNQLGFEQETLSADGGNANYLIEVIESSQQGFRARATSVVDFDGDGVFNVWEINEDKQLIEINKD